MNNLRHETGNKNCALMDVSHFLSYLVYLTNPKERSWHRMKTEMMYMTQMVSLAKEMRYLLIVKISKTWLHFIKTRGLNFPLQISC